MSTIITRNSANSGSVPSSLIQGELAINVTDGRLFYGSGSGNTVKEFGLTSSYALNALSASHAQTASFVQVAQTASYVTGSDVHGPFGSNSIISASYATTASVSLASTANIILVLNQSGNTIAKGVVVHITASGNSSDIPRVITASYENDNNSANTLGITSQAITNGSTGYVTTEGVLTGINTNAFTSGQLVYLGATGSIIGSAPVAPLHSIRLGQVVRDQSNNGSIYVRVDNGYELGELHDVVDTSTTSSYGDLLVRSGSVWINSKQLTGSYAITGSLTATSFTGSFSGSGTITSASYALTASYVNLLNQNVSISGALDVYSPYAYWSNGTPPNIKLNTTTGIAGTLQIAGDSSEIKLWQSSGAGNGMSIKSSYSGPGASLRFGRPSEGGGSDYMHIMRDTGNVIINASSDAGYKLDVNGTARVQGTLTIPSTGNYGITITRSGTSGIAQQVYNSSGTTYLGVDSSAGAFLFTNGLPYASFFGNGANYPTQFGTNGITRMTIFAGGNVGINTTTDAGYLLDVNGTGRFTSNLIVSGSTGIGTTTPFQKLDVSSGHITTYDSSVKEGKITFNNNASALRWDQLTQKLHLTVNTRDKITVESILGYVGINQISPLYQLDVSGSGNYTNDLTVTGSLAAPNITGSLLGTSSYATTALSASFASTASFINPLNQSVVLTGSLRGQVSALSIVSTTASLDLSTNNFFTLTLANGADTHINPTNIQPGQTVNLRVTQGSAGTGTVSFPSFVDQASGSAYTASTVANAIDIVTMIAFDSTSVYLSSIRNMI